MPDPRDGLRQGELLAAYERALLADSAAPRLPGLDPDFARVAEELARHLGGPMPDPTVTPDPTFRVTLRARLAGQAWSGSPSSNGASRVADDALTASAASPAHSVWRGRRGEMPGRGSRVEPAAPIVPPLVPPEYTAPGRWRGGWAAAGAIGRAGTALLLVAIVAVAVLLLRPSSAGPGGPGASPDGPTVAASVAPLASATAPPGPTTAPSASSAPTQPPVAPRWQATGALSAPRADHTATRLADGRILVVGGHTTGGEGVAATAELYDPQTGRWAATGAMGVPRFGHRAVLLADGRVLVVGGLNYRQFNNTTRVEGAELYDPASGVWSPTAPLPLAFTPAALVVLTDGRALSISSPDANADRRTTAAIYDPRADRWAVAGNPAVPNVATAVALHDGSAIVLGALGETTEEATPAARYDPASGEWAAITPLPGARGGATLSALPDGRVLAVGGIGFRRGADGITQTTIFGSTAIYDPATGAWVEGAGLTTPRSGHSATTLSDGRVLIVGGNANNGQGAATAELYDPQSRTWTTLGAIGEQPRRAVAVAPLADSRALVVGGDAGFVRSEYLSGVQLLTPPAAPRVTTQEGTPPGTPGAAPGAGVGKWDSPNAGLLFFGGRGYRVREQTLPDGSAPTLGPQVGTTVLPVQSGGVFPAGVPLYAVAGQPPEGWLAIRDGARVVLYRQDDNTTALLAGFQVVIGRVETVGETVCPGYGCPAAPERAQPGTVATAQRLTVERALQGGMAPGETIEIRQLGVANAALPNDRVVTLAQGQRVILFLQPARRQSFGDFAGGDYSWTGTGWAFGFVGDQVVPLGGAGGVPTPLDRFEAALRDLFAAVTPRAPTDPVPTPRPVPTATGIAPQPTAPLPGGGPSTPTARP